MAAGVITPGTKVRLKTHYFPGHHYMKMGDHNTCFMDVPPGTEGVIMETHGSYILIGLLRGSSAMGRSKMQNSSTISWRLPSSQSAEVWVHLGMLGMLFEYGG